MHLTGNLFQISLEAVCWWVRWFDVWFWLMGWEGQEEPKMEKREQHCVLLGGLWLRRLEVTLFALQNINKSITLALRHNVFCSSQITAGLQ